MKAKRQVPGPSWFQAPDSACMFPVVYNGLAGKRKWRIYRWTALVRGVEYTGHWWQDRGQPALSQPPPQPSPKKGQKLHVPELFFLSITIVILHHHHHHHNHCCCHPAIGTDQEPWTTSLSAWNRFLKTVSWTASAFARAAQLGGFCSACAAGCRWCWLLTLIYWIWIYSYGPGRQTHVCPVWKN